MTAMVPAWTGSLITRSTWSVIEPTMLSAMIGMPTERSSSAAMLISPPMIEPARTSIRARGRSATARTAAAMFSSPTSGIVSTEIFSPRRLCRSASVTAPSATWATCAPPPTTITRLPNTLPIGRVTLIAWISLTPSSASTIARSSASSTSSSTSTVAGSSASTPALPARRTVARVRTRPPARPTAAATIAIACGSSTSSRRTATAGGSGWGVRRGMVVGLGGTAVSRCGWRRCRRSTCSRARSRSSGRAPRTRSRAP